MPTKRDRYSYREIFTVRETLYYVEINIISAQDDPKAGTFNQANESECVFCIYNFPTTTIYIWIKKYRNSQTNKLTNFKMF